MKRIIVLVFAVFAIVHVHAKEFSPIVKPDGPVGVSVLKKGSVIQLFYRGEERGRVKVTIYNEDGRLVYSEVIRNIEEFMRPYNFSKMPEGVYAIEVEGENGKTFRTVEHRTKSEQRVAHLTQMKDMPNRYVLLVPNKGHDVLTIRILDEENHLLYKEVKAVEGDFAGLYKLERANGHPTFEVTDSQGRKVRLSRK